MTSFEQFVQELTSKIQIGSPLFECSRVDIALSVDSGTVMVLLYAQPQLTDWMLATAPFQYPLPLLLNNRLMYQHVRSDIGRGIVTPTLSELMRAAMAGITQHHPLGTMIDEDAVISTNKTFYVPIVGFGDEASPQSKLWGTTLLDERYPVSSLTDMSGVIQLAVIHMPNRSVFELSNKQLLHVAKLTVGWNYSRMLSDENLQFIAEVFLAAAINAHTVVEY